MKSTFLIEVDHGDDTDLQGVAFDLQDALETSSFPYSVLSVKPWTHPSLLGAPAQTPPVVPET